ncbi:MAG TPA: adenylate/guanylate cyclase domain-containing protein [Myxococcota bacterium]|nr:adenylate/guanylate cyclase domain-containing protein [Myxococcota bacterium]
MDEPVRYARNGDVHVAYRVFGESDRGRDIVLIPGTISHVELLWEVPAYAHLIRRLTAFARVIVFDKPGQGLSDRVSQLTLEERISDVRAVMDAAGSTHATLYGWSEGGQMSMMFAATYPQRTSALILYGAYASLRHEPWLTEANFERFLEYLSTHWGEGALPRLYAPSVGSQTALVQWFAKIERASASPGSMLALFRANYETDVRQVLSTIQAPTLVLHRADDRVVRVAAGRYLAEHIPGARYRELPGSDHHVLDRETMDVLADEIQEFITGTRQRSEPDRVLATVMFSDIVGSAERAARLGDERWGELLRSYYEVTRKELTAFRGHEVDTAGDGLLATFDGPARAIRCACAVRDRVRQLGLDVRIGLHAGECELIGDKVSGIAVHIGARVASAAQPAEVVVSSTVKDLVAGSGIAFADRGTHVLKGVPGEWRLFTVR